MYFQKASGLGRIAIVLGLGLLSLTSLFAWGQEQGAEPTPSTAPAAMVALSPADLALVKKLSSASWHERKAAQAELERRTDLDAPTVRAMIAQTENPEAQTRLNSLLTKLADQDNFGPSLITLHMKDASAKDVYAAVFRQAHAPLATSPPDLFDASSIAKMKISLDADRRPFWEVMQKLWSQTGMTVLRARDTDYVLCISPMAKNGIVSGPLLINFLAARVEMDPKKPDGPGTLVLNFQSQFEPKIALASVNSRIRVASAVDNQGRTLAAIDNDTPLNIGPGRFGASFGVAMLKLADKTALARLADFKGVVSLTASLKTDHQHIDHLQTAPAQALLAGAGLARFAGMKKIDKGWQMTVEIPKNRAMMWLELFSMGNGHVHVSDESGNELYASVTQFTDIPNSDLSTMSMQFLQQTTINRKVIGPPDKLVSDIESQARNLVLPFEMKDIDLKAPMR